MNDATTADNGGDIELKGKDFDEVCDLLKRDDTVKGSVHKRPDGVAVGSVGRWAYCFGFQADQYSEAELLDLIVVEYGPGIYPVQFKGKGKGGRPKIRWQKDMTVQARRLSSAPNAPTSAPSTPAQLTGLDSLAAALESQARILEKISDLIARPPPPIKTTIDFVQELGAIKDLFSDNQKGALEQFKDAMELRKLIKDDDGDGGDDPLSMAIKTLTPAIERGITALQESDAAPARPTPAKAPSSDALDDDISDYVQANPKPDADAAVVYAFQFFAEKYLPAALQLAETGEPPEQVAAYLVRLIGDDAQTIDRVGLVIMQNDMVMRFAQVNARVLQFTEWFDQVGDWLAHALWPATNPAPGQSGATETATNDETVGAGGINDADASGAEPADATSTEGQPPDAKPNPDAPPAGDSNDT